MLDLQLGRGHPRRKTVLDAKQFDNKIHNLFSFLPFFPTPSPLFYLRHFSGGL